MSAHTPVHPPLDNLSIQLSIPEVLDFHLKHNPDFPLYTFANDDSEHPTEISMLEYVRAAHRAGAATRGTNTGNSKPGEIVAIIALLDSIVFSAIITGMMKVGLVPFPISTLLSPDIIAKLIQKNNIRRVLTTNVTLSDFLSSVRDKLDPSYDCQFEEAPSLSVLYPKLGKETAEDDFSPLSNPFCPTDEDLAMCIHSSGSTGLPKTIPFTHRAFKSLGGIYIIHEGVRQLRMSIRMAAFGLLLFHVSGVGSYITTALYGPTTIAVFPPRVTKPDALPITATPENTIEHLERTKAAGATALLSPLNFISHFARSEKAISVLRTLVFVFAAGGFIPTSVGDHLVSCGVRLHVFWAGTEFGIPTLLSLEDYDPRDWSAFALSKRASVKLIPHEDGLFRFRFMTTETFQPAVENLPDEKGFEVADLFERHPTREGFWRIVGRVDDVIVQSNGQKTLPGPIEDAILSSPLVNGAVVFGRGHVHIGVLVELSPGNEIDVNDKTQVARVRDEIWPFIENINKEVPQYSRIVKEMILIVSHEKPLPIAAKGTVTKAASLTLYEKEIEEIYKTTKLD